MPELLVNGAEPVARPWLRMAYVAGVSVLLTVLIGRWAVLNFTRHHPSVNHAFSSAPPAPDAETAIAASVLHAHRPVKDHDLQILMVGNSQTTEVVDEGPGDFNSSQWLEILLHRQQDVGEKTAQVRMGSLVGINMVETFLEVLSATESKPRRADVILLAISPAHFRKISLREAARKVAAEPEVQARLRQLSIEDADLPLAVSALAPCLKSPARQANQNNPAAGQSAGAPGDTGFIDGLQNRVERFASGWRLYAQRDAVKTNLAYTMNYWRNALFGVTTTTVRPIPPQNYSAGLQLLEMLARYAQARHLHLVLVFQPIRPGNPSPFPLAQSVPIRKDLQRICTRYHTTYLDYIGLIAADEFANVAPDLVTVSRKIQGQPDFSHFIGQAHEQLAARLVQDLGPQLVRWASEKRAGAP